MKGNELTSTDQQGKGCVDTTKRRKLASLNITIEFTSIPDGSNYLNFTADACEKVLMSVKYRLFFFYQNGCPLKSIP